MESEADLQKLTIDSWKFVMTFLTRGVAFVRKGLFYRTAVFSLVGNASFADRFPCARRTVFEHAHATQLFAYSIFLDRVMPTK